MPRRIFLVHKDTGSRFEVVKLDKEKNEITLKGEISTIVEPYDKERLKQLGYNLVQEDGE